MVNRLQHMTKRVVKAEQGETRRQATAKGGLVLAQRVAQRTGLWSGAKRCLPPRKDPTQGFPTKAVACAMVHGLLAGGRGFRAAESLRDDAASLRMLGLSAAPSAETTERVVKDVAARQPDAAGPNALLRSQCRRTLRELLRRELLGCEGFFTLWGDGSLLEVQGRRFDSIKTIKGRTGQMCAGVFVGPMVSGLRFALEGEGEKTVVMGLLESAMRDVVEPLRLRRQTLVLLDSLYGGEPTFDQLETYRGAHYIVGVTNLARARAVMNEMNDAAWFDTGACRALNWDASGLAVAWLECEGWSRKRTMVCRRWRRAGEMIWEHAAVVTDLEPDEPRVAALMRRRGWNFAQAIWHLYSHKQALENQWKEMLIDMGLHHPPSARARVNSVFHALGAVAYNLSVAIRRLALVGADRTMRLWRLRRELFDLAAEAIHHGRKVVMRFIDSRHADVHRLLRAMERLRC